MNIMDTMAISGRRRNTYSPEFKREVVATCGQPGASVARVALFYGLNTNVVHRWRHEARDTEQTLPAFVPLRLEAPVKRHQELTPWRHQELTPYAG